MPPGRSSQRGFVRGVGITRSGKDRQNKRVPTVQVEQVANDVQQDKLGLLQIQHPYFYGEAEKFARRFGYNEERTAALMVKFIEEALKQAQKEKHNEQLLEEYHRKKAQSTEQSPSP